MVPLPGGGRALKICPVGKFSEGASLQGRLVVGIGVGFHKVSIKIQKSRKKVEEKKNDLCGRLFEFAVRVIKFLKTLPYSPENKTIRVQLSKSACSSGANYEEAQSGSSKPDFTNKVRISLREMRESNYWLRIIKRTVIEVNKSELDFLIKESSELKSILGSIVQKTR
jgi:four helix bundle protein